ncbi:MAG: diaminopimelate decarboxylase [Zoogloeaceae bacterium]|jgi:diaminopimelate decarboxylase|nr:diaminopimelate decarboxylase [Zoogloeaceae bacterium]
MIPDFLQDRHGTLHAEGIALPELAERFGTPLYLYSLTHIEQRFAAFKAALVNRPEHLICYAVKANANLSLLSRFARLGAGFDIVSGGELQRVLKAGGRADKIVFSGVGKSAAEMRLALDAGILCFNVESEPELLRLSAIASQMGKVAPVSFRVNPDVDPQTHPYIATGLKDAKFGIPIHDAPRLYRLAQSLPGIAIEGIDCHIGSQILSPAPHAEALCRLLALLDTLADQDIPIHHLDLGGGFGIAYEEGDAPPSIAEFLHPLLAALEGRAIKLLFEPGRWLIGNAGVLLTRIEYVKQGEAKNFCIVDAAMNDLLRPALYEAHHEIVEVETRPDAQPLVCDVVGPVCETGDCLGHDRRLAVAEGELLAILSAGAYGMAMCSNYNARPRAAEVAVEKGNACLIRRRETPEDLWAAEDDCA